MLQAIKHDILKAKSDKWKKENTESLKSLNDFVEKYGLPLTKHRKF